MIELKIPSAGESITQVQIGAWLKAEGEYVERDEPVAEIETDKASMELPAPAAGVLTKHLKPAGEIIPVGTVIALIDETAARPASTDQAAAFAVQGPVAAVSSGPTKAAKAGGATGTISSAARTDGSTAHVMPAARRALAEAGLQAADVTPTGPGGRLLKEDVQRAAAAPRPSGAASAPPATGSSVPAAGASAERAEEVVPMSMLRRRIAQRLVEAKQVAALLTTFNEIDLSAVLKLREQRGADFEKRYGVKLGFMSFFVKAAIDALKRWPAVNGEIRGDNIVYKNYYDIGVAVSTEYGLVVPVIRDADRLSFAEIEQKIGELAGRARERKLTVEELQGGTFSITNGGVFGSLMATPIVNFPQSAILGMHAMQDRPVARDGQVVIRPMMYVALTYDHRIIDGRESVSFLKRIKECVEDPSRMLVEV